ncbi:hypothetical protein HY495_02925 [Candidatus Woesearchaeota archaeon]|nr:hypothetical protein [Candidatus Woesearchaeota archaeon]
MNYIPHAKGLTEELLTRDINITVGDPTEKMALDRFHRLTSYPIFDGERQLGVVEVNSWDARGITQVDHVAYDGIIPGYMGEKNISMTATASRTLDISDPEYLRSRTLTEPNNTFENPLYRHDGYALKLADHEVDGLKRIVLSEESAMQLERDLERIRMRK